ncbi:hypothetical protein ABEB36_015602 [Hypothenemus hampei]|uniref:OTU domain-containing protein n=1 Tax=Hypothenemus hampei TaxID=57062 RepID=A0ABD1DZE4_HYPHA
MMADDKIQLSNELNSLLEALQITNLFLMLEYPIRFLALYQELLLNTLKDKRTLIHENKWNESFKLVKQQILSYLIKQNELEDRENFLKEFQQFIDKLPEVPHEFIDCTRKLKEINFNDWDIEEKSFDLYKAIGENYIKLRNQAVIDPNNTDINMFNVVKIPRDSNCFYTAVADQLRRLKIKNKNPTNLLDTYYTYEDLRALAIDYIKKNRKQEFGKDIEERLQTQNTEPLHGDLPSNIHKIDQYIELHSQEGVWADSGMIGALSYALDITIQKYIIKMVQLQHIILLQDADLTVKKIVNLQNTGNHYNSLVPRSLFELLPFEKNILSKVIRSREFLKYSMNVKDKVVLWYTDEDMNSYGRVLEKYSVNLNTQFSNRLTEDDIKTLLSIESLKENYPRYISIVLVRRREKVTILYKDSKGDWNNSSKAVETLFKEQYKNKVDFIKHSQIMALKVKEANDEGKDGISELIRLFKGESGGIAFTTQDQVQSIRISHSLQNKSPSNTKQDINVDDLRTIMTKLDLGNNYISMEDGKKFDPIEIKEDCNCFYAAVADQLRRLEIKNNEANNQPEEYYTHENLRGKNLVKILKKDYKTQNTDSLHGDLPSNIHTVDQYIEYHSKEGVWADSGMLKHIILCKMPILPLKKIVNLQYTGTHYNSLIAVDIEHITSKKEDIESYIHKIDEHYDKLKDWKINELKNWSRKHKGYLSKDFSDTTESADNICRAVAVMDRANELSTRGHRLLVAALKVMQGYKTHIITSNNVLAADGVKDKKLFYDLLNITTTDNNPDDRYTDGPKACYNKDIVYGGIDFNNIWVMLDEIDSLLIDQGGNIAKLSGPFPGMDSLRYVYINIWIALAKTEEQIKNQKDHLINKTILAQHLHQYAEDSIERWIEHAFTAKYKYKENVEYKISKDKDGEKYYNSGKISADDKFVNDVAIAALGELARTQIKHEYVDEKQQSAINKPRAVLIVCASRQRGKSSGLTPKIRKYRDEIDAHITESILDVCDIVIATNLAGRGTDFKTSARLEGNCGLHVILAFLPCNKRVEDQGLGRTGRQGNNGTGQIITKISELEALGIAVSDNENIEFKEVITRRDKLETMRVNDIADNKITELEFKGQLFNKFSSLYGSLKKRSKTGTNAIKWIYVLRDLKEKMGILAVEQEYDKFLKEAKSIINGTISHNPFYKRNCPDYKRHAVEHLEKAAKALTIEHDYLEELIGGKNINDTQQEESVLASIIISEKGEQDNNQQTNCTSNTNLFLKHLQARLVCLAVYKENIASLIKQIKGENKLENLEPQIVIGVNDGAIIDCKVPRYLSKLDSHNELKKHITERSVDELEYVEVIAGAQIQIGGAFALLASAAAFPVLLPVNGPLAGAMISEGITDIITALIQQGQSAFNKKDYVKGKVISYGISVLTMGIGALISSTKILSKAMNACRSLAAKLRAVKGPFAGICKLETLAKYLELMIEKIELARKTAAEQAKYLCQLKDANQLQKFQQLQKSIKFSDVVMTHGQKITQIAVQSAIGAITGVPIIKEKVRNAVSIKIKGDYRKGTFNNLTDSKINQIIEQLFNTSLEEDIKDVSKQIGLGILRHSSNWKMQLATLAFESILTGIDIATCTNASKLTEIIITQISEAVSGIIYSQIVAITGKIVVTLPKALYRGYKKHQEKKADEKAVTDIRQKLNQIDSADDIAKAENTKCVHDAVSETLGLDNNKGSKQLTDATNLAASKDGASIEDTKQLFMQNGIEVTSCGIEDAQSQFVKQGSDRGVICLSNDQGLGHVKAVTLEGNCLMISEKGQKIPLDQYKQKHGYSKAECIIPKNMIKMKFGQRPHIIIDSTDPNEIGKVRGNASVHTQINSVEGKIIAGKEKAHSRESHVGKVEGKTSFKDKGIQDYVYKNDKERRVTTAKVNEYEGYDWTGNKRKCKNRNFQYVKLVEYKGQDGKWGLQTMYPCDKPQDCKLSVVIFG